MNILAQIKFPVTLVALVMSTLTCSVFMPTSGDGDEFLGKLAIVLETDTAAALKLTEPQRAQLEELYKSAQTDAVELVMSPDGDSKLEAFRKKTEAEGLAILTEEQRTKLDEIIAERAERRARIEEEKSADVDTPDPQPSNVDSEDSEPAAPDSTAAQPTTTEKPQGKLRFNFQSQQWSDVLHWFADQADLSLVLDAPPLGTFNYTDDREYTPDEAIDLLNSVLLTKGYTLVRRDRMLMLINLEDGIPPNLVTTVDLKDLDKHGEFELISVLFQLDKWDANDAAEEIRKLIGPQGSVVALPKSRQVFVTETAGRLRSIRTMIKQIEEPGGEAAERVQIFAMKYILPEEAMDVIRQLMDIDPEANATSDGSLRFAIDATGGRLLVTGRPGEISRVKEIIDTVDVPGPGMSDTAQVAEDPKLRVYSITTADSQSVLSVMQTLLAGVPDVRLDIDPKTGNLVAFARKAQHEIIAKTLDEMQRDAQKIEVIKLHTVDAQLAVLSINKLFGGSGEEPDPNAPQVDADPTTGQLLIRGTGLQIEQIRGLLEKMGESDDAQEALGGGNIRMIPLQGRAAKTALERIGEVWPSLRRNRIRVVTPSAAISTIRPSTPEVPQKQTPKREPQQQPLGSSASPTPDRSAANGKTRAFFAVQTTETDADAEPETQEPEEAFSPADIVVAPGPGGLMIASADLEALDQFEMLLNTMAGDLLSGGPEITIFYLKHTKAEVVARTLDQILGGGTLSGGGDGGGDSALDDLADAAGGGILGALMGGGGGSITPSGTIQITPDARLNALIVQAGDADIDLIEQLLKKLDQKESPEEILVASRAEMIPIYNTQASEIADIVKEIYKDRLVGSSGGGSGGGRPSPEQFMQMLRGGRGGGGSSRGGSNDAQKMSVSVDMRTNSLVVAAPEQLFLEVKQLVEQLDFAAGEQTNEVVRTVRLGAVNANVVQEALSALMGESVKFSNTPSGSATSSPQRPSTSSSSGSSGSSSGYDAARREMFMRMMQRRSSGRPGGYSGRPGGYSGRSSRGGSSRGPSSR